ncbi:hypothetical protein [Methyloterricola oryzae]|uniref:hypothetical protein n=1 Tax=Methyloterricola oryzae TaxID=1495050 RepID=UPI0005EB3CE1|nr:hypothetical protein [Methyloterricola oryzae]
MTQSNVLSISLASLLLSAAVAPQAQAEYPPEFVPSVVYRDADLIAKHNKPIETAIPSPTDKAAAPAAAGKVLGQPDQPVTADYVVYGVAAALLGFVLFSARRKA